MFQYYTLLKEEIKSHPFIYMLLLVTFVTGVFLRTYRMQDLLGFYYDQGRDALEVYKILGGKLTLIGPTTGFAGIFRGPFWFYWLTPGYVLGNGNPAIAAIYISTLNALGILVIYTIGARFFNRVTGLIAALLVACSYYAIVSARWLSNPSPVWIFSPLAFLCIVLGVRKSWKFLALGLFSLGITLQLEEAGMGFVVLAVIIYLILHVSRLRLYQWGLSIAAFFITFLPLAFFDIRHEFLNTRGVIKLIFGSGEAKSFGMNLDMFAKLKTYSGEFGKELFINGNLHTFTGLEGIVLFLLVGGILLLVLHKKLPTQNEGMSKNMIDRDVLLFALLWLFIPLFFLYFYQQPLYEYYMVGLYPIFFLVIAILFSQYQRIRFGFVAILLALIIFLGINKKFIHGYITSRVAQDSSTIALENQMQAMEYIFRTAGNQTFAVAEYVPPQLTYSYDYLLKWYRTSYYPHIPETPLVQALLFYTLHEIDSEHSKLAQEWLLDKDTKAQIIESKRFGGITVEKREVIR